MWGPAKAKIALSSGEAEFSGIVKAASDGMGVQNMMRDLGYELSLTVQTDSSAAIGMGSRSGLGRVKHLDIRELWIQERIMNGDMKLVKVPGEENVADLMTKHLDRRKMDYFLEKLCIRRREGRHVIAPAR